MTTLSRAELQETLEMLGNPDRRCDTVGCLRRGGYDGTNRQDTKPTCAAREAVESGDLLRQREEEIARLKQDANRYIDYYMSLEQQIVEQGGSLGEVASPVTSAARQDTLAQLHSQLAASEKEHLDAVRDRNTARELIVDLSKQLAAMTAKHDSDNNLGQMMLDDAIRERDNINVRFIEMTVERDCYKQACTDYEKDNEYVLNLCGGYNANTRNTWVKAVETMKQQLTASQVRCAEYRRALTKLSTLGGGRSEGNCIAQEALDHSPTERPPT